MRQCELQPQFPALSWQEWHPVWSSAAVAYLLQGLMCCAFRDALLHTSVYLSYCCLSISLNQSSLSLRCHANGLLAKRLMHMAHLSGNTSGVSKLSSDWLNYTGFPGDVCVAFFNVSPGNKDAVELNPLMKEESRRVYNCDDERLSGSNKRWIFKSMWNI